MIRKTQKSFNQSRIVIKTDSSQINPYSKGKSMAQMQQCQSRIQSRISTGGNRYDRQNEQQQIKKQQQQQSLQRWLEIYNQFTSTIKSLSNYQMNDPLQKYETSQNIFRYFKISLTKVANIPAMDIKSFSNNSNSKYSNRLSPSKYNNNSSKNVQSNNKQKKQHEIHMQICIKLVELNVLYDQKRYIEHDMISTHFVSEYYKLDEGQIRQTYEMNEDLDFYFYVHKNQNQTRNGNESEDSVLAMKMEFYTILLEKDKKVNYVIDKVLTGSFYVKLDNKRIYQDIYFINQNIEGFYDSPKFQQQINSQNNKKSDQHGQIKIKQSDQFSIMSKILIPYKIYTNQSKVSCLKNYKFPSSLTDIQKIRYNSRPCTLNFQLRTVFVSNNLIFNVMDIFQNSIKLKYQQITKIQQIQVKEYRMIVCCHNGEKILSSVNFQLKKENPNINKILEKNQNYRSKSSISMKKQKKQKQKQTKNVIALRSSKQNHLQLFSDKLATLDFLFDTYGIVLLCQVYCRVQIKVHLKQQPKPFLQSATFPLSYFIKPVISLQNDIKHNQILFNGQFISHKGLSSFFQQYYQRQQQQIATKLSKVGPSMSRLQSFSRIGTKAEKMTQSNIQFYIFKQQIEKAGFKNYSTISQSGILTQNLSQSFAPNKIGNQMNKLLMQKARIFRQRQKIKQKMHRINLQQNRTIPLLDTTELKMQIYQEKLSKIKQDKYELKSTLNYLKSKVQQFEHKQKLKRGLIQDTLKMALPENRFYKQKDMNLPKTFINAKGGVLNDDQHSIESDDQILERSQDLYLVPINEHDNGFDINVDNITKLIDIFFKSQHSDQTNYLQIEIEDYEIYGFRGVKNYSALSEISSFEVYGGFQKIVKLNKQQNLNEDKQKISQVKLQQHQKGQNSSFVHFGKLYIQLPQYLTSNFLATFLFAPFCLYFINSKTKTLIGTSFIYLNQLCNSLLLRKTNGIASLVDEIMKVNKTYYVFNKSQIKGKIVVKSLSLAKFDQIKNNDSIKLNEINKLSNTGSCSYPPDLINQIQSKLSIQKQPQQKRKMMRIQNFKKKNQLSSGQQQSVKLKSTQNSKQQIKNKNQETFSQLSGQQITILYHCMNFSLIKVQLQNKSFNQTKNISISIKDPDKQFYQIDESCPNELNVINNPLLLQSNEKPVLLNQQTNRLYLQPNSKGVILLTYNSLRKCFNQNLNTIQLRNLDMQSPKDNYQVKLANDRQSQKQLSTFLYNFNHKHNLNMTIASQTGIQKVVNLQIIPKKDLNVIYLPYYLESQTEFYVPLPKFKGIQLSNIYFQHQKYSLVQLQDKSLLINGYAPQLNKVSLVEVLVFPHPHTFALLQQQYHKLSQKENKYKQIIRKLMSSEKILNLTFQIWGCKRVLDVEVRLFDQVDVLWEIQTGDIIERGQNNLQNVKLRTQNVYLNNCNPESLGFRSMKNSNRIQSCKKISLNTKQQKNLVKSVLSSHKIGSTKALVQIQNKLQRQKVLSRYLLTLQTPQPYISQQLKFQIQLKKIEQILLSSDQENNKNKSFSSTKISEQFLLNISSLLSSYQDSKQQIKQLFKNNSINFNSTSIFIQLKNIELVEDEIQINKFIVQERRKHQNDRNKTNQNGNQLLLDSKSKKKLKSQEDNFLGSSKKQMKSKKQIQGKSKKQIQQTNNTKSTKKISFQNEVPCIVRVTLQIDTQLLVQTLKINSEINNNHQQSNTKDIERKQSKDHNRAKQLANKQKFNLFEQLILSTVNLNDSQSESILIESIIGLKYNQKILYYNVVICEKVLKDQQRIIQSILQRHKKKKRNDLVRDQDQKNNNLIYSPSNKLKNFYLNQ